VTAIGMWGYTPVRTTGVLVWLFLAKKLVW